MFKVSTNFRIDKVKAIAQPTPYQTAIAIVDILEIDRNILFDDFAQFMDYPYSDRLR